VAAELELQGATTQAWDCIELTFGTIRVRPLDGQCSAASDHPGDPCLSVDDCPNGVCEGSQAAETVPTTGIELLSGSSASHNFDLDGQACVPTIGTCGNDGSPCSPADPCSIEQGTCFVTGPAAPAFFIPSTPLPDGLYEVSQFEVGNPIFYSESGGTITQAGGCSTSPFDIVPTIGKLRFIFDAAHGTTLHIVIDLAALESATTPFCDFQSNVASIISLE
jgi:hypothetical protein